MFSPMNQIIKDTFGIDGQRLKHEETQKAATRTINS